MVGWIAKTKRFVFLKDPVADVKVMKQKIEAARSVADTPLKYVCSFSHVLYKLGSFKNVFINWCS